jgi:hypothetical protein
MNASDSISQMSPQERSNDAAAKMAEIKLLLSCGGFMKNEKTSDFYRDTSERLARYRERTMISVDQLRWIWGIHRSMKKQTKGKIPA